MPTDPLEQLLHRDLSAVVAKDLINIASPLLLELVNFSTNAFTRCATTRGGNVDEDLAVLTLYLHAIEMTDAVEVLVSQSCPSPAQVLLRSIFEAVLGIEYMVQDPTLYSSRSLAWLVAYVHDRLESYRSLDPAAPPDRSVVRVLAESNNEALCAIEIPNPSLAIKNLQNFLAQPHIVPFEKQYQEHKGWKWYQMTDRSLSHLRSLARRLRREADYVVLYKHWSSISHAHDLSRFLTRSSDGQGAFAALRDPGTMQTVTCHAATLILRATRLVLGRFRPDEDLARWYTIEVRDLYMRVCH